MNKQPETPLASLTVTRTRFKVEGMDCAACVAKIDTAVRRLPGITGLEVSLMSGVMTVQHGPNDDLTAIKNKVAGLGYTAVPLEGATPGHGQAKGAAASEAPAKWWQGGKARLTMASGIALVAAFGVGKLFPQTASWVFILAMLVGLMPIARRAVVGAFSGTPFSIEMLMSVAAVGAAIIGAGEEGASVVFLFLVGELLEGVAASKARASIQSLTALVPKNALIEEAGKVMEVLADSLAVGAVILVRPGDRLGADGVILEGASTINEAPITGESTPVSKGVDAKVYAGTINGDALLRVRVTATAADNTIARVVKLVEEAQDSKAPTERFIERFSRWYTPGVVLVAALVAVAPPLLFGGGWAGWIYKGLAILLIGCPCALVISTPAAIAASLSAGARRGLLLKGGAILETLGKITAVAFDKTGTLTEGKPQVTDVIGFTIPDAEVLKIAAALETGSSHPLAASILARAMAEKLDVLPATGAHAMGGKGIMGTVEGAVVFLGSPRAAGERVPLSGDQAARIRTLNDEGKTVSVLLRGDVVVGAIAMRDEPRADAQTGLKALNDAGIKTLMLTGDNHIAAAAVGKLLGIEVRAELLPEDKQRIVRELQQQGLKVAKIGDGINDAPALAAADVGIAMGGGTDVALETAGAAVLHSRVSDVAAMIELSKRTMRNIKQNVSLALGFKAVFLVTTVIGITGLWPAILADTGATVLVTINALHLLSPATKA
jgi:Cd2+/Zn2+-exporting ATPase